MERYEGVILVRLQNAGSKSEGRYAFLVRDAVSYTHLRAHETKANLVCRLLLEKKKKKTGAKHKPWVK